jgi:hypothetical protein
MFFCFFRYPQAGIETGVVKEHSIGNDLYYGIVYEYMIFKKYGPNPNLTKNGATG